MKERLEGFPLNIRTLQEYIAFARVLNFSAAAKQLFISQSTLSTHMSKLENDLGVSLINHGAKPSLTPCGKLFLQYAESIVVLFLESVEAVIRYEIEHETLIIEEPVSAGILYRATVESYNVFSEQHPNARITLRSILGHTPLDALQEGFVDIVKTIDSNPWNSPESLERTERMGISIVPVACESPVVWMQEDHSLAAKSELHMRDLKNVSILVPADVRYDDWRTLIRKWFEKYDLRASIHLQVTETMTEFYMTKPGDRVFILPETLETGKQLLQARGIVPRRIVDDDCKYYVSLTYLTKNANKLLPEFIGIAQNVLQELSNE